MLLRLNGQDKPVNEIRRCIEENHVCAAKGEVGNASELSRKKPLPGSCSMKVLIEKKKSIEK